VGARHQDVARDEADEVRIVTPGAERDRYLPLFYAADDSTAQIQSSYQLGDLYVLDDAAGDAAGIVLAIALPGGDVADETGRRDRGECWAHASRGPRRLSLRPGPCRRVVGAAWSRWAANVRLRAIESIRPVMRPYRPMVVFLTGVVPA